MTKAEEYRRRAWRCLTLARLAVNAEARAKIVDMAEIWMRFAQRAEQQTPVVSATTANTAEEKSQLSSPERLCPNRR
jgi:hypothetical protein